jgi:hypothetical protein
VDSKTEQHLPLEIKELRTRLKAEEERLEEENRLLQVQIAERKRAEEIFVKAQRYTESIKITNKSKDVLDIQAVTLEYLDEAGKPIPYKPEEKVVKVYPLWKSLQPEAIAEGTLDVTMPMKAIKEESLRKVEFNLVYVPSPLKRETLTLSEKVE